MRNRDFTCCHNKAASDYCGLCDDAVECPPVGHAIKIEVADAPPDHDCQFAQDDECDGCYEGIPPQIDVACRVLQLHCGSESDSVTGAGRVSSELVEVAEKAIREFIEGK